MKHVSDPPLDYGPLFELEERETPAPRLFFEGPAEDVGGRRERRLAGQLLDVFETLRSGDWLTLEELGKRTGHPTPSISAQLRHLRKERFGGFVVERTHVGGGLYQYRLALDERGRPRRVDDGNR